MSFYTELSKYYNEIFPVETADMDFWVKKFAGCRRILDVGCGTGNKTVFFSRPGVAVIGIDLDSGMIEQAGRDNPGTGIHYQVMDMLALPGSFEQNSFDGLICLGNSLAHLDSPAAAHSLLKVMGSLLAPGGLCLIQILNYDRILRENIAALPRIETENVIFERAYGREGKRLIFTTTLTLKASGQVLTSAGRLYPLCRKELEEGLAKAGFEPPELYGTYQGSPFTEDSALLLSLCRKK